MIDPFRQAAYFWKNNDGMGEELAVDEMNIMRSEIVPGFWLRVDWLFAEDLPDESEVLAAILSEAPNQSS